MNPRRLWRALRSRWTTTILVAIVAASAVAAAVAAPSYEAASRTSILHDTFARASFVERGVQLRGTGALTADAAPALGATLLAALGDGLGNTTAGRLFARPILTLESNLYTSSNAEPVPLVSRDGVCLHVRLIKGRCPHQRGEIMVSASLSRSLGWRLGDPIHAQSWPTLHIVGIYVPAPLSSDYWFGRQSTYFPYERPPPPVPPPPPPRDAAFTPAATMYGDKTREGTFLATTLLNHTGLRSADVPALQATTAALGQSSAINAQQATVTTSIPAAVDTVHSGWRSMRVPVVVITAELVLLAWLLLFLLITGIADARADEVALARLRGQGGRRVIVIGVGEPLVLLVLALPVGVVAGWALATRLTLSTLRPGTPTPLPAIAWAAAGATVLGGLCATGLASWRALRTDILRSRQTTRSGSRRGWLVDAIVLTAAAGGLIQIAASGAVTEAGNGGIVLLVPATAVLAAAVVASRVLPLGCRALFRVTGSRGPIAPFLAVRSIARRVGGSRMVMLLATATGLLTFAVAAWSSGNANRDHVAAASLGAVRVLDVAAPADVDLATAVNDADPTGRQASAVVSVDNGETELLAVQPLRFAHVAAWSAELESPPDGASIRALHPRAPTPLVLHGGRVRLSWSGKGLTSAANVTLDVLTSTSGATTPVDLGRFPAGSSTRHLSAALPGCPCRVLDVNLSPASGSGTLTGTMLLRGLHVRSSSGWSDVPNLTDPGLWATSGSDATTAAGHGLLWSFHEASNSSATLQVVDHPSPLPALITRGLASPLSVSNLDGSALDVTAVAQPRAVPGARAGVVVAIDYARLAARSSDFSSADQQVWLAPRANGAIEKHLLQAGVQIFGSHTAGARAAQFRREGPGLAALLYVVTATAATVLAALGAVASFWADGRRRRYEYAALLANKVPRHTLRAAVVIEQLLMLLFAAVVGVGVGYAVAVAVLPHLPQFVTPPSTPLTYRPPSGVMSLAVIVAISTMALAGAAAGTLLIRSVRPDLLREGVQ